MNNQHSLTLLGKVNRRSLKKLGIAIPVGTENTWFFADYTNIPFKINECFDTLLKGTDKTLIPGKVNIRIKEILDQFGFKHKVIPKGFKTILHLEFSSDSIHSLLRNMPTLATWNFNENPVSLAHHQDIKLAAAITEPVSMYRVFFDHVKTKLPDTTNISRSRFITVLIESKDVPNKIEASHLLNKFKILGFLEENANEELALTAD